MHSVFGYCGPQDVVSARAAVPVDGSDKAIEDLVMQSVEITRCAP